VIAVKTITLVSYIVAKEGYTFQFKGGSPECMNCRFRQVCIDKLKVGHVYRVIKVMNIKNKCPVNEYVITVEVTEVAVDACIPKKYAIESMIVPYSKIQCGKKDCRYYRLCRPELLPDRARVKVTKVFNDKIKCPRGLSLLKSSVLVVET